MVTRQRWRKVFSVLGVDTSKIAWAVGNSGRSLACADTWKSLPARYLVQNDSFSYRRGK